ncbi:MULTISPECIES: glycosyltransferase [unclassified Haladaptatus]|uniref:glycosyltransferase n=1 Tax=unclassified Haladaptatus TaxID=2622732 RepID=UPI0023E8AB26|nr:MULTISPECIES: glycosyltransferase [unclassified Haladaptatus]
MRVVLCPHLSLEHYRGGEKWTAALANRLVEDGVSVAVRALPYAPDGVRRVAVRDVLDSRVSYREAWHHDLSAFDTAYLFYNPLSQLFFTGAPRYVAGIHSWLFVTDRLYEPFYGVVPTGVKLLYRLVGPLDLRRFDVVHSVTRAYRAVHPRTVYIPNFVDTHRFSPDRAPLASEFTILVTAAHIPEKGWDLVRETADRLPMDMRLVTTGTCDDARIDGLGFVTEDELAMAYARAHVVLHPARVDTDSMVINEACASGTPVITTPIATHLPATDAVLHAETVEEIFIHLRLLRTEWEQNTGYTARCEAARAAGEAHDFDLIYPQLKSLLLGSGGEAA